MVTGGTSGIGERIVEVFVAEGANVVVAARRQDEGTALVEKRLGVSFIRTDVAIGADVKAMIDHAAARFKRIDCLINNAGSGSPMVGIAEVDVAAFDQIMAVNVRGVFLGSSTSCRSWCHNEPEASLTSPVWPAFAGASRVTPTPPRRSWCMR